jgi:hypothetical protein
MIVRSTFPGLRERATKLLDAENYAFFYDDVVQQMSHGYYVNVPTRSEYHYGLLYTEARLGSVIAIGKGDAPEEHWFRMARTLPPDRSWQSQAPRGRKLKEVRGHRFAGGWYEWQGERYVPSWGGSMFEALMPTIVLDERVLAPKSLGANAEAHVRVQRRHAGAPAGSPVWGFSPSAMPVASGYGEYGVRALGTLGYDPDAVTPHAAALALAVLPDEAVANLRALATRFPLYGEWGFYDAVDPKTGAVAYEMLALDQAMIFVATVNALTGNAIPKRFAADPSIRAALPLLGGESFFD